jgi:SNARE protein
LAQDIEWAENTNQGKEQVKKKNIDEMTTNEITKHALLVQDKTQETTARAKKALDETIQIGTAVNEEVKKQGEKIREIEEGLDQVETNLKRADKQVRIFIRY